MDNELRICIINLALEFAQTGKQARRLGLGRPFPQCCPFLNVAAECDKRFNDLVGRYELSLDEYEKLDADLFEYQSVLSFRLVSVK